MAEFKNTLQGKIPPSVFEGFESEEEPLIVYPCRTRKRKIYYHYDQMLRNDSGLYGITDDRRGIFSLGEALESNPVLLSLIFSTLNLEDLKSAALVDWEWKSEAERILRFRKTVLGWFTFNKETPQVMNMSSGRNLDQINPSSVVIFYDGQIHLFYDYFIYPIQDNWQKTYFADFFRNYIIPKGVNYCFLPCWSVFFPSGNDLGLSSNFGGCFFPDIPNIEIVGIEEFDQVHAKKDIKCLLEFSSIPVGDPLKFYQSEHMSHLYKKCAMTGCGIGCEQKKPITYTNDGTLAKHCQRFWIAFIQRPNTESRFEATSIFIDEDRFEDLDPTIEAFKKRIKLRKNSLAFWFTPNAVKAKIETQVLSKHFPQVFYQYAIEMTRIWGWTDAKAPPSGAHNDVPEHAAALIFLTWD